MEYLFSNGWRTLMLDEFLQGYMRGEWPPRTCLLTFDDGFENLVTHALPILNDCGYTAAVFIVAGWVGKTNDWDGQRRGIPKIRLLGWEDVRAIANAGMEIGAHSLSHPSLPRLSTEEAEREILECRRIIQERVGCAVQSFAYPFGEASHSLERFVTRHFKAGFGTRLGFVTAHSPKARLERIDVYYLRQPRLFHALADGGLPVYLQVREWLRNLRRMTAKQ